MPVDETEKRMIGTRVAYRVGPVRIRQQRVRQGKKQQCYKIVSIIFNFIYFFFN